MSKKPKMSACRNCNMPINKGVKICPSCGAKQKKPFYKRIWFIVLIIIVLIGVISSVNVKLNEKKEKEAEYRWPTSELAGLIPQPESKNGKISSDSERYFSIDIYNVTQQQFEDYVDECKQYGFTEDYSMLTGSYRAKNVDGFSLTLSYYDEKEEMGIMLSAPSEETKELQESPEQEEDSETDSSDDSVELEDGMRPEFKKAMDSYENFMNDYCEFMEKYASSDGTDLGLLNDYTDYLSKYAEFVEDFEAWDGEDLNDTETAYYIDVQTRISKKLLSVQIPE